MVYTGDENGRALQLPALSTATKHMRLTGEFEGEKMATQEKKSQTSEGSESSSAVGIAKPDRTPDEDGVREHAIREAAYRRFEARGGAPGDERQDWLDAQAEIDGRAS